LIFLVEKQDKKVYKRTFNCLIYAVVKNESKMNEKQQKPHSVFGFGFGPTVSVYSVLAQNFHFGASLILNERIAHFNKNKDPFERFPNASLVQI
jgi:hypothetical protein